MTSLAPRKSSKLDRTCQVDETAANSCDNGDQPPREEISEKRGYDCEFVESPPKQLQSECPICLAILREPHLISCCGYNFCAACIERVIQDGKPCPLCNSKEGFTTIPNKGLKRSLDEFHVHCPHRDLGCKWVEELGKLDRHLNPGPQNQLDGCQFTELECIYCKACIRRFTITNHQTDYCPKRPYTCEYCEEYESTFEDVAHKHWAECKCYLLPCPNNCSPSGSGIERQNLEHHLKEECLLTVVECDLHYAGCAVKLPRKDMPEHMKELSVSHISLLAAENKRLAKEVLEKDDQLKELIQQNTELRNSANQQQKAHEEVAAKVNSQTEELTYVKGKQQKTHQELTRKVISQTQEITRMKIALEQQQKSYRELSGRVTTQREYLSNTQEQQQKMHQELRKAVEHLEARLLIVPTEFKMEGFKKLKDSNTSWLSPPFYTHACGYKLCLQVYANGNGDAEGNYISVFVHIMRGEFDSSHLKWPFRGVITLQLSNQLQDKEHHKWTITYSDRTACADQVTDGERSAAGWGNDKLLLHTSLDFNQAKNRQYLKDDCLILKVLSVELKS